MWLRHLVSKAKPTRFFGIKYSADHEWLNYDESTKTGVIGITDYAQGQLGDIVHITLPKVSEKYKQSEVMATIESVKVVGDIYAPITGSVIEINNSAQENPDIVNQSAENKGWLIKIKFDNLDELSKLMDKPAYDQLIQELIKSGH